jgi:flagellar biogenesis protein FliO
MEPMPDFLRALLALTVVVLLMLVIAWVARRFPALQKAMVGGMDPRMKIVSSMMIDARHRMVIVKIDEHEKIFLLSPESATEVTL